MSKKTLSVFLTACLLLGAVVLGVHLMHDDALAVTAYAVTIGIAGGQGDTPLEDAAVWLRFWDDTLVPGAWTAWTQATESPAGVYTVANGLDNCEWEAWVEVPNDIEPANPDSNPTSRDATWGASFYWVFLQN